LELLRLAARAGSWAAGLGEGLIDGVVELVDVGDLDPALLSDDKDAGSASDAETVAQRAIGFYFVPACAAGIHHEGHGEAVGLEPAAGEGG
jgi:hypothetical protein